MSNVEIFNLLRKKLDANLSNLATESTLSNLYNDVLNNLWKKIRFGRVIDVQWIYGDIQIAPPIGTNLSLFNVPTGQSGFIYGYYIVASEANQFNISWVSGGITRTIRVALSSPGAIHVTSLIALNEGLPADSGTTITITNINVGGVGQVYQAGLLIGSV